ncbi:MAG: hypothetical protein OJF60_000472 [Burkholderiaceae bacterium]|nr:MAG: hypothetical protein OJF60_000472 [Burkholderiaceae bacterium]
MGCGVRLAPARSEPLGGPLPRGARLLQLLTQSEPGRAELRRATSVHTHSEGFVGFPYCLAGNARRWMYRLRPPFEIRLIPFDAAKPAGVKTRRPWSASPPPSLSPSLRGASQHS